jgi:uncharacterized membrane protein
MTRAAVVLGIGLGGFFDGIVLHQLLQWHHMLSSAVSPATVAGLELNTLADGVFHSATWVITVVGVWMLVRSIGDGPAGVVTGAVRNQLVLGGAIAGWGGFNLVEGLVNHFLLRLHHVRPGPDEVLYDLAFLLWGVLFIGIGWWLVRTASSRATENVAPAVRLQRPPARTRRT